MRWMWIDRIVDLVPETRLVAVKNVTLAEDYLHDHFPAAPGLPPRPVLPAALIIEGMAQTAGILAGSARRFRERVILAKVVRAELDFEAFPGDSLRYEAELQRIDDSGAATTGLVSRAPPAERRYEPMGRIDLLFSHLGSRLAGLGLPEHNFVFGENLKVLLRDTGLPGLEVG